MIEAYVELGVALATESGVAAWSYAPELWGRCGQGPDEATALAALTGRPIVVVERVAGDEQVRPRRPDLLDELATSAEHVRRTVLVAAPDLVRAGSGEIWTTTKLLRRLAWHEPSELITMHALAAT